MKAHIYTHPSFLRHDTGPGHPECAERLSVLLKLFQEKPFSTLPVITAEEADYAHILRAHTRSYVENLQDIMPERGHAYADNDTVISPGTWNAAMYAVGTVCRAVDDAIRDECDRAFCAVRPPGHHAGPAKSEGFCLFNNIFIGAMQAKVAHGLKRIAIVDFDVHHGNGTDTMARGQTGIFFASTHEWPLYPGTGLPENDIEGHITNITLKAGDGSEAFRAAWIKILAQLDDYAPQLIMISAGFDAHKDDPLANINLTEDDFSWVTEEIGAIADKHANGKIVSVLEGGYNLDALKRSVASHLAALFKLDQ